jgi:Concanavalin A-like lectin/glucanases superfamily/Immunoglobulin domain
LVDLVKSNSISEVISSASELIFSMKANFIFPCALTAFFAGSILTMAAQPQDTGCLPPPSGMTAWWRAENDATDNFSTNTGVLLGDVSYAAGEVGQAFNFTGTNDAVKFAAGPDLNVGSGGGFTVEAWINPSNVTQANPIFEWNDMNYWGVHFHIAPGQPFNDNPGPGELYANIPDAYGNWHQLSSPGGVVASNVFQHVALTYDQASGVATIYCNGQIVGQQNIGGFTPRTGYDLYLGRRAAPAGEETSFAGLIDEPAVYNRALSQDEITAIYNAGSSGKCPGPWPPSIISQPANQSVTEGGSASFSVAATGTRPLSYQWTFNGKKIANATSATLTLTNLHPKQSGNYAVIVSSPYGTAVSSNAVLTVTAQTILVYNYSGTQKIITSGTESSNSFSGQMFYIPASNSGVFVGWAVLNGSKQYWVTSFSDYQVITIAGSLNHTYTIFGKVGEVTDEGGAVQQLWSFLHQGLNTSLAVGNNQTFSFPNSFNCNDTQIYPGPQTGNLVLNQANSTYAFAPTATQSANNAGRTVADLVNVTVRQLVRQGYRLQSP